MGMAYVEVSLDEFSDEEIADEYEARNLKPDHSEIISELYECFRLGKKEQVDELLRTLFAEVLGRIA